MVWREGGLGNGEKTPRKMPWYMIDLEFEMLSIRYCGSTPTSHLVRDVAIQAMHKNMVWKEAFSPGGRLAARGLPLPSPPGFKEWAESVQVLARLQPYKCGEGAAIFSIPVQPGCTVGKTHVYSRNMWNLPNSASPGPFQVRKMVLRGGDAEVLSSCMPWPQSKFGTLCPANGIWLNLV